MIFLKALNSYKIIKHIVIVSVKRKLFSWINYLTLYLLTIQKPTHRIQVIKEIQDSLK